MAFVRGLALINARVQTGFQASGQARQKQRVLRVERFGPGRIYAVMRCLASLVNLRTTISRLSLEMWSMNRHAVQVIDLVLQAGGEQPVGLWRCVPCHHGRDISP
jgi:hypothetical protein